MAIHDGTGLVASVMLPDADGTVNQPRMMAAGTNGTAWAQRFNVPSTFSKQARFRTSWTGGLPGWGGGVDSFQLGGQTVLTGGPATELGQAWSSWSPTVTGSTDVVWSTTCANGCMSAADLFEWRTWETGAARFQTRLRFPGQYADAETDSYENWNRYYDPPTGRYWSPEPILSWGPSGRGAPLVLPIYGYASGNPVSFGDLDGLEPGKPFKDMKSARQDWYRWMNKQGPSDFERGGLFYELPQPDGTKRYSYTHGVSLPPSYSAEYRRHHCDPDLAKPLMPEGARDLETWHTHGSSPQPSPGDLWDWGRGRPGNTFSLSGWRNYPTRAKPGL